MLISQADYVTRRRYAASVLVAKHDSKLTRAIMKTIVIVLTLLLACGASKHSPSRNASGPTRR